MLGSNGQHIEIQIRGGKDKARLLTPCLVTLDIPHTLHVGNISRGEEPSITLRMRPRDDEALLRLWDEITDLRMRYLEARQAERVVQLTYLEGSEEVVVL